MYCAGRQRNTTAAGYWLQDCRIHPMWDSLKTPPHSHSEHGSRSVDTSSSLAQLTAGTTGCCLHLKKLWLCDNVCIMMLHAPKHRGGPAPPRKTAAGCSTRYALEQAENPITHGIDARACVGAGTCRASTDKLNNPHCATARHSLKASTLPESGPSYACHTAAGTVSHESRRGLQPTRTLAHAPTTCTIVLSSPQQRWEDGAG